MDDREIALNKQGLKASSTQFSPIVSEEGQYDPFEKEQEIQLSEPLRVISTSKAMSPIHESLRNKLVTFDLLNSSLLLTPLRTLSFSIWPFHVPDTENHMLI